MSNRKLIGLKLKSCHELPRKNSLKSPDRFAPITELATAKPKYVKLYQSKELPSFQLYTPVKTIIELNKKVYTSNEAPDFPLYLSKCASMARNISSKKPTIKNPTAFIRKEGKRLKTQSKPSHKSAKRKGALEMMEKTCNLLKDSSQLIRQQVLHLDKRTKAELNHCRKHTELVHKSNKRADFYDLKQKISRKTASYECLESFYLR